MFFIDLTVLLICSVQISAFYSNIPEFHSEEFVFPLEKSDDFTSCTLESGTIGQCINLSECPNARDQYQSGTNPTLCHFENKEPVVCCVRKEENLPLFDPGKVVRRKSLANCEDVYSLAVPSKRVPGEFHTAVVDGQVTSEGEFPHMAALGWLDRNKNIDWECGGTLISHEFVLTAAHCVIGRFPPDIVRVGETDLINTDLSSLPQDFGVDSIIGHPNYQPSQLYYDIALIKLDKNATITTKVRPACLWQGNTIDFTDVTATGYGHTEFEFGEIASKELFKADLKIFTNDECTVIYQNERSLMNGIVESQLCAGNSTGAKNTCQDDSGGTLQVKTMNGIQIVYHVVGIKSFGNACATSLPGVYTRVSHYLDWIEHIVW